jgi:hypothetical protein
MAGAGLSRPLYTGERMQSRVRSLVQGQTMKNNECYSVIWAEINRANMVDINRRDFAELNEAMPFAWQVLLDKPGLILSLDVVDPNDMTVFEREF